jgi:(E)-4-hydroxy-3-methylbut-2-enyl-diphosphate synthase
MVRQALEAVRFFEKEKFYNLKISVKTPEVALTMECYRRLARLCDYPLHIGLTAAGPLSQATMKNAMVIGGLLSEGIGDTIRVSLTGSPEEEVRLGICILQALGLRPRSTTIVSCPTCGRCNIDLLRLVEEVEKRIREVPEGLEIAVMGCVVNGPGEARRADIGVAGGKGFGFIFRRGKRIRKVPQSRLVEALLEEAKNLR